MTTNTRRDICRMVLLSASVSVAILIRAMPPLAHARLQSLTQTHHIFLDNGSYSEKVIVGVVGDAIRITNRDQTIHRLHFASPQHNKGVVQKVILAPICWIVNSLGDLIIVLFPIILGLITLPRRAKNQSWVRYFRNSKIAWWATITIIFIGLIQILKQTHCGRLVEDERADKIADRVMGRMYNRDATGTAIMAATETAAHATVTPKPSSTIEEMSVAQATNPLPADSVPTRRSSKTINFLGGDIEPIPPGEVVTIPCNEPGIGIVVCDTCPKEEEDLVIVIDPSPVTSTPTNNPTITPSSAPTTTMAVTGTATSDSLTIPPPSPTFAATAIPKPTVPPVKAPHIVLNNPANGSAVTEHAVPFGWSLEYASMNPGEVFEIRVCGKPGCTPDLGITSIGSDGSRGGKFYGRSWSPESGGCQWGEWCTWTVVLMREHEPRSPRVVGSERRFKWVPLPTLEPVPTRGEEEEEETDTPTPRRGG